MSRGREGSKGITVQKEGFYGGPEPRPNDKHELKGLPTYGKNQFPDEDVLEMRHLVLDYIEKATKLGLTITETVGVGIGWDKWEMRKRFLKSEPFQLFRAFKYSKCEGVESCGIGEHSDFSFLAILSRNEPGVSWDSIMV